MAVVFLNGELVEATQADVSVWDGGWLHGAGLFETMRAHRGRVFRLDAHLDRLMASAATLLFPFERPDLPLTSDFDALLQANGLSDARVRMTVTAGNMLEDESSREQDEASRPKLTACVTAIPAPPPKPTGETGSLAVCISPYKVSPVDPIAGHKCTSYLPRLIGLREARSRRCGEALWFTTNNALAEGCISNVFLVRDGALLTPPPTTPVLPGITRSLVLQLAGDAGIKYEQRTLHIDDLLGAEEVFLTNTIMALMPVSRIEKHDVADGKPGPITRQLGELYLSMLKRECDPHAQ